MRPASCDIVYLADALSSLTRRFISCGRTGRVREEFCGAVRDPVRTDAQLAVATLHICDEDGRRRVREEGSGARGGDARGGGRQWDRGSSWKETQREVERESSSR